MASIAEIPEYGIEVGIYGFVERNAITVATFTLGIAVFVVLTFDKTANLLDQDESREFLLLIFSSFVLSLLGVLPLYWVPQVFGWLTTLRHLKTVPYTFSLFILAAAMLIYLAEILAHQRQERRADGENDE
jgi:ABC-type multidrug transport system fused ATPase/permease subunit